CQPEARVLGSEAEATRQRVHIAPVTRERRADKPAPVLALDRTQAQRGLYAGVSERAPVDDLVRESGGGRRGAVEQEIVGAPKEPGHLEGRAAVPETRIEATLDFLESLGLH